MDVTPDTAAPTPLSRALDTVKKLRAQLEEAGDSQPLAIIGTGLRFPGGIDDLDSYWQALAEGRDLVRPLPEQRKGPFAEQWDRLAPRGGFLDEIMDFDAAFFGMGAEEATALDPQHRLLLEVAWEALENAALPTDRLDGARTGLFVGIMNHDWWQWLDGEPDRHWTTGNGHYFAAGRLAYELGLGGPAIAVDTACSSSLVSVHLARQALARKECDVALAGGVNLALSPHMTKQLDALGSLAPDAKCKAFDARANGFARGEGCGVIVLKRLADARRDGDRVLGVLKGSAVNQYGRSTGFTAPNVLSLINLMEAALADAGLTPADIGLVEAHGTGTSLGDTIEMEAIVSALGRKNGGAPLPVGTVKANMGHLESAAGIAALLKAVACLRHGAAPPLVHFSTLNPLIDLDGTGVTLPTELTPWPQDAHGRHIAVSALSMGGTNAHVILGPAEDTGPAAQAGTTLVEGFELSAKTPQAVRDLAARLHHRLTGLPADSYPAFAYSVTSGRTLHKWRARVSAPDREPALDALKALAAGESTDAVLVQEQDRAGGLEGDGPAELPRAVIDLPAYPWQRRRCAPQPADRTAAAVDPTPATGVSGVQPNRPEADRQSDDAEHLHEVHWQEVDDTGTARALGPGWWLLFADRTGVGDALAGELDARSGRCVTVRAGERYRRLDAAHFEIDPLRDEDLAALFEELGTQETEPCAGVVHAWSLDDFPLGSEAPRRLPSGRHPLPGASSALGLIRALARSGVDGAPRLVLLTRGAQRVVGQDTPSPGAPTPLWALAGVAAGEHAAPLPAFIDLDPLPADDEAARLLDQLLRTCDRGEEHVVLRGGGPRTPVLVPHRSSNPAEMRGWRQPFQAGQDDNHRVLALQPGILDSLESTVWRRTPPGPGQVEIEVTAAGLNFSDVLKAMGAYPGAHGPVPLGIECAGRITAVGEGVEGRHVGDPVMAVTTSGLAAYVTTEARLVASRPAGLTDQQAATTPVAFLTAVYGLEYLARLRKGEKVLIHSATGGVGLAALMVARRRGAEVFATAGTEDKRRMLHELGISPDHVMDSRSLDFAAEIRRLTGGYGVDVVLNSVTGQALVHSLGLLAPGGRFVEIGKRDIYDDSPIGLGFFKDNRSLFAVDLEKTLWEQPQIVDELFEAVQHGFASGQFEALPVTSFPYAEAGAAFARMAQARHVGKLVLTPRGDETVTLLPGHTPVSAVGTYLIAGEPGTSGLAAARRLAGEGARHLALVGHGVADGDDAAWQELRSRRVQVEVLAADAATPQDVAAALEQVADFMPPPAGVVHVAGSPQGRSGLLTSAAWQLHQAAAELRLDFFVWCRTAAARRDGAAPTSTAGADEGEIRRRLLEVEPGHRRRHVLVTHVTQLAAEVLDAQGAPLDAAAPLASLGFDSMRTLELRARLQTSLRIKLPATVGWRYPTIEALVPFLAERMEIALEAGPATGSVTAPGAGTRPVAPRAHPPTEPPVRNEESDLEALSDSELAALLLAKAEQIDEGHQG